MAASSASFEGSRSCTTNNVSMAARAAGVDRSNFRRLLKQYEVGGRSLKKEDGELDDDELEFDEQVTS